MIFTRRVKREKREVGNLAHLPPPPPFSFRFSSLFLPAGEEEAKLVWRMSGSNPLLFLLRDFLFGTEGEARRKREL